MSQTADHYSSLEDAREQARNALLPSSLATNDGRWDGFVNLMQRALPVVAVIFALLTMLWPLLVQKEVSFTLSHDDVARTGDQVHMQGLHYSGTDNQDRPFEVRALTGVQDHPTAPTIRLTNITAVMETEPGTNASIKAEKGVFETENSKLSIAGPVSFVTDTGYSLTLNSALINLKDRTASSDGGVTGTTPIGTMRADSLSIDLRRTIAHFNGRVRLHITPNRTHTAPKLAKKDTP